MADIVGNYLSNYYTAQDRGQQQAQQQMQNQRQAVADQRATTQFDQTNQLNQLNLHKAKVTALNDLLSRVPDGNAQAFEAAKAQALQHPELGLKPEDVANLTVADLPRLKMETGQTQALLDMKLKELQVKQTGAQIGLIGAQTDAAKAQADYVRSGKGLAGGKPLTSPMNKEFGTLGDQRAQVQNAVASFKDEFASRGVMGFGAGLTNTIDRNLVGSDAAKWWQSYDRYKNVVRNDLFGASLTAGEQAAFDAADITPGMNAETIKSNLALQQSILDGALGRRARSAVAQGFNKDAIMELTGLGGTSSEAAPANPPPPSGGPVQVRTTQDYQSLPSGTQYVDPQGVLRVKK